jgi:hypothetical protein
MPNLAEQVEELRCFVPALSFAESRQFYAALGAREVWSNEKLSLLELGGFRFFLQDYFVKEWAENTMLDLRVKDADAFASQLEALKLEQRFPGFRLRAPSDDASTRTRRGHFIDPSSVLWHFSQSLERR